MAMSGQKQEGNKLQWNIWNQMFESVNIYGKPARYKTLYWIMEVCIEKNKDQSCSQLAEHLFGDVGYMCLTKIQSGL